MLNSLVELCGGGERLVLDFMKGARPRGWEKGRLISEKMTGRSATLYGKYLEGIGLNTFLFPVN